MADAFCRVKKQKASDCSFRGCVGIVAARLASTLSSADASSLKSGEAGASPTETATLGWVSLRRESQRRGVRDARNNERQVCGRRRDGEAAG